MLRRDQIELGRLSLLRYGYGVLPVSDRDGDMKTDDTTDPPSPERDALDKRHDSDARGEHRYPDDSQSKEERRSRRERDDLKRRLERQS